MARYKLKTADGEGFLRAFWDEWRDIELAYGLHLKLKVLPSERRGILVHWLEAWKDRPETTAFPKGSVRLEYPSSQVQSYEAFLYALGVKLSRLLEMQVRYPEGKG